VAQCPEPQEIGQRRPEQAEIGGNQPAIGIEIDQYVIGTCQKCGNPQERRSGRDAECN
jgi:hypothetical protein